MTETYGVSVQVHVRQIVAPIGAGEARIPALVRLPDERLFLFYDERPAPASGTGADFNGLTMASDLPNPNQIRWMERNTGLRVKMCVWLGVSRGLDLAFLNAD